MVSLEEIADHFRQMAWRQVKVEVGPASPAAIARARRFVVDLVGVELPPEFPRLWELTNGIDYSGAVLFGAEVILEPSLYIQGLVEENEMFSPPAPFVHVGSRGDEWISWHSQEDAYYLVDKISDDPMFKRVGFMEMLWHYIAEGLEMTYNQLKSEGEL